MRWNFLHLFFGDLSRGLTRHDDLRSCQGRDDHLVGDLGEVAKELTHRIEVVRRVQTHDLVSLALYARE